MARMSFASACIDDEEAADRVGASIGCRRPDYLERDIARRRIALHSRLHARLDRA